MKQMVRKTRSVGIGVALALATATSAAAATEFVILRSTMETLPVGTVVRDAVKLGAGDRIVAIRQDGERVTIEGPHTGPIGAETTSRSSAMERIVRMVEADSGYFDVGVVRGGDDAPVDSFNLVAGGDWCGAAPPVLVLPSRPFERVVAITADDDVVAEFRWTASASTAPWPATAPLTIGRTYLVSADSAPIARFTVRALPPRGGDVLQTAAALHDAGCRAQAHATLLRGSPDP